MLLRRGGAKHRYTGPASAPLRKLMGLSQSLGCRATQLHGFATSVSVLKAGRLPSSTGNTPVTLLASAAIGHVRGVTDGATLPLARVASSCPTEHAMGIRETLPTQ